MKKVLKRSGLVLLAVLLLITQMSSMVHADEPEFANGNLAYNKSVTSSGSENNLDRLKAEGAVDGVLSTDGQTHRWSGNKVDNAWLQVDLGQEYVLENIRIIFWAETVDFEVLISTNGVDYESIQRVTDGGKGTTADRTFIARGKTARYVKFQQHSMWLHTNNQKYSASINELIVTEYIPAEVDENTIRVGTFNIAANKKPSVDALRQLTDTYNLEVVGLQEVDRNTSRNNYDMLEAFTKNNYIDSYYAKAMDYSGGEYGIGTVSRYSLSNTSLTNVDTTGAKEPRVFQRMEITKGTKTIAFYNLHFSPDSKAIRAKQFAELKEAIKNDSLEYKIIVGDFNADQSYDEFYTFLDEVDMINGYEGTWYDTFNETDTTMKVNSVDNILFTRNMSIKNRHMIETKLSDHNLLLAELEFLDTPRVSKEALRVTLEQAEIINASENTYTKASFALFSTEYDVARAVFEGTPSQEDINATVTSLQTAINNLVKNNLAYKQPVTYSDVEGGKKSDDTWQHPHLVGENAVDGDLDTRWSAGKTNDQWYEVDLGEVKDISEIIIRFESQTPKYEILISEDGDNYTSIYEEEDGIHGAEYDLQISFPMQSARYVKFVQKEMWYKPGSGYYSTSFYEFEVYKEFIIESLDIVNQEKRLSKDTELDLEVEILPELAKNTKLLYESSDSDIIAIDNNGKMTAVGVGKATIKAISPQDSFIFTTREFEVVDGSVVTIKEGDITLTNREKRYLHYSLKPEDAITDMVWESTNPAVATINEQGVLETAGIGTADITVKSAANPETKDTITVTVEAPTYHTDYDTMQDRWIARVAGDTSLDMNDADTKSYVEKMETEGISLWLELNKNENRTRLWPQKESDSVSADYTTQFVKIKSMALAFATPYGQFYQSEQLLNDIVDAINFMVVNKRYDGNYYTGNWWDWQIGCAQPLTDTLMIISDYVEYSKIEKAVTALEGYAYDSSKQWPSYNATGANRTDIGLVVLGSGIIAHKDARIENVINTVPSVMDLVESNDGIYADGSIVQHTDNPYNGSYGNELIKGIGRIQNILRDTHWEIIDERFKNVYDVIIKGYIPLMNNGQMMSMVNGRSITRAPGTNPFTTEFASGSETIANIMLVMEFAPEEYKKQYAEAIKYWLESSEGYFDFFANSRDFAALMGAKKIAMDDAITAKRHVGMNVYGSMDRVAQSKDNYRVGISMYSKRIANYEHWSQSGNTENGYGWYTGDGAMFIYNNDLKQFDEGYWPTIDWYRLPGITVDTRPQVKSAGQDTKSSKTWVGGTTDGENGAVGMYLDKTHLTASTGLNLTAQKSWFLLDGQIVALGANINGTSPNSIETIVENRMMTDSSNAISVNGIPWTKDSENVSMDASKYIHFTGTGTGNDLGYYFPKAQDVTLVKENRSGTYKTINDAFPSDKVYTYDYFKTIINHGSNVQNGNYEYVIVPGATDAQMKDYVENNTLEIVQNNGDIQAIKDSSSGVFAMNVWNAAGGTLEGIKVNKSASIYTTVKDDIMTISISDPKHTGEKITLTLEDGFKEVVSTSTKVEDNNDGKTFTIDTMKSLGSTHTIKVKLNVDKSELQTLVDSIDDLDENNYTSNSWMVLETELVNAKAVLNDNDASSKDVEDAKEALQTAIDALVIRADITKLNEEIEKAEDLTETDYTATSWSKLQSVLQQVKSLLMDTNATQKMVNDATKALADAIEALVERGDTTKLQQEITKTEGLTETDYTETSWSELQTVLQQVKPLLTDTNATQKMVDQALEKLQKAVTNLELEFQHRIVKSADGKYEVEGCLPSNIQLIVEKISDVSGVTGKIKDLNFKKNYEVTEIYNISLLRDNEWYQPDGELEVRLTTQQEYDNKTYQLVYINEIGEIEVMNAKYNNKIISFVTDHFSKYGIAIPKTTGDINNKPSQNTNSNGVSTGDTNNTMLLWYGISLSLVGILLGYKKKYNK